MLDKRSSAFFYINKWKYKKINLYFVLGSKLPSCKGYSHQGIGRLLHYSTTLLFYIKI